MLNVIAFNLAQSDHNKRFQLYNKQGQGACYLSSHVAHNIEVKLKERTAFLKGFVLPYNFFPTLTIKLKASLYNLFRFFVSRSAAATTIEVASLRLLQDAFLQRLGLDGARPDRAHDEHLPTFRSGKGETKSLEQSQSDSTQGVINTWPADMRKNLNFKQTSGHWALFSCGPRVTLSLRPLFNTLFHIKTLDLRYPLLP